MDVDGGAKQLKIKISFKNDDQLSLVAKDAKNCEGIRKLLQRFVNADSSEDGW